MEEQKPKKCYYELMGVKIDATQDEIKRSFKKLSLKYHPDKNRKNPEAAKEAFQEITEAYNCLCDEKERQWYDNNREKLLMNKDDLTHEELQIQSFGFDIFEYFEEDCFEGFGDDAEGYFAKYKKCFSMLDYEEERTYKFQTKKEDYECLPTFGDSKTDIEEVIKFYDSWSNFMTIKVFAWADQHDTRDGENRYEKRQMESDNEKLRRKEKKQYNQTIKDLVAQIKKIDPRRAQLLELEKKQEAEILKQREANKGSKQLKKEKEQREREEKRKRKEEEEQRKFLEAKKRQEELIKAQQAQAAEELAKKQQKKKEPKKEKKVAEALDEKAYNDLLAVVKNGGTLTKKQQKEVKKYEAQQKAEQERLKQKELAKKREEEKKTQAQQDAEEQEQQEDVQEGQQNGDKKKRKRNKKKKANATEQQEEKVEVEEKKPWKPKGYSDDEEEQNEEVKEQNVEEEDQEEEQQDGWGEVTGSSKAKARIQKEVKKKQKAKQSDKRSDETKNIEDNYFASVDDNHLKKFDRKQEQKQKKKQQDEEDNKYY